MNFPDDEILELMIHDLRDLLGEWNIAQIEHAVNLGLKGSLDVDMNLYNKPLNMFLLTRLMIAYQVYIRPAIMKAQKETGYQEPTEEQKKDIKLSNILISFNNYKKTENILNAGNSVYNALKERINADNTKLRPLAETLYKERQSAKLDRSQYKTILLEVIRRAEAGDYNEEDEVGIERIMCDLRLKEYFDQIIEMEMNIEDII